MCTLNSKKCMRPGPITSNGYLNFLREYRTKKCGMSATETVRCGAKEWNKLSCEQKAKYRLMDEMPFLSETMLSLSPSLQGCKVKKRRTKKKKCSCKKRRSRRHRRRGKKRCKPKRKARKARNKCHKKKKSHRRKKAKCVKKRTGKNRRRRSKKKCMRGGPITNNGYLNFLRWFRKCNCGMSPKQAIKRGARKWCSLPQSEKDKFNKMACKVSTSKRRRKTTLCRGVLGKGRC